MKIPVKGKTRLGADHHEVKGVRHAAFNRDVASGGRCFEEKLRERPADEPADERESERSDASLICEKEEQQRDRDAAESLHCEKHPGASGARVPGLREQPLGFFAGRLVPGKFFPELRDLHERRGKRLLRGHLSGCGDGSRDSLPVIRKPLREPLVRLRPAKDGGEKEEAPERHHRDNEPANNHFSVILSGY